MISVIPFLRLPSRSEGFRLSERSELKMTWEKQVWSFGFSPSFCLWCSSPWIFILFPFVLWVISICSDMWRDPASQLMFHLNGLSRCHWVQRPCFCVVSTYAVAVVGLFLSYLWSCTCIVCVWGPRVSCWPSWGSPSSQCLSRWMCMSSSGHCQRREDCGVTTVESQPMKDAALTLICSVSYQTGCHWIIRRCRVQTRHCWIRLPDILTFQWAAQTPGYPKTRSPHWSCGPCSGWSQGPHILESHRRSRSSGHIASSWQNQSQPRKPKLIQLFGNEFWKCSPKKSKNQL